MNFDEKKGSATQGSKSCITIAIWFSMALACTGTAIALAATGQPLGWAFLPLVIALLGTVVMWYGDALLGRTSSQTETAESEKAKRQGTDRLSLVMDLLDDEERAAFKETLMRHVLDDAGSSADGELPYDAESLAGLMHDEAAQQRRQR